MITRSWESLRGLSNTRLIWFAQSWLKSSGYPQCRAGIVLHRPFLVLQGLPSLRREVVLDSLAEERRMYNETSLYYGQNRADRKVLRELRQESTGHSPGSVLLVAGFGVYDVSMWSASTA
jgi:hypothetical protein